MNLLAFRRVAPALLLLAVACGAAPKYPILNVGAAAPGFTLPAADGKTYGLADFAASPVLAVVFTCNHCPESQAYESRLRALDRDYRDKGVAVVAINPNDGDRQALAVLANTDVNDSLEGMKIRAAHAGSAYPYLYDGDTQATTIAFGVDAMPQVFIFDRDRKLRYRGRLDDSVDEARVGSRDARAALDAVLSGAAVRAATTRVEGCEPEWLSDPAARPAEQAKIAAEPVPAVIMAGPAELKALRKNGTNHLVMVNFWATWCGPCVSEFPDLEDTFQMYRGRGLEFVAVSANDPGEKAAVVAFLTTQRAAHRNFLFGTPDAYGLQEAFDPNTPASLPFTLVIAPNGDVVYQELGASDIPKLRRAILANLPDDPRAPGAKAYWTAH